MLRRTVFHLFQRLAKTLRHRLVRLALWCWCLFGMAPVSAGTADLIAYTEEWPPYNFTEGSAIKGIATELLQEACALAQLHCEIHMVPWARAYKTAQNTPQTLVYTTARKPSREKVFLWVGPIAPRTTWVYGNIPLEQQPHSLQDLAQWRIGVVRDEAAYQDLLAAGIPASALIVANSNAEVLRMLSSHMVDAMVDTEVGMQWNLRDSGPGAATVNRLLKLSDEGAYYFALNPQTQPEVVSRLQGAIDKLRRNGRMQAVFRAYGTKAPVGK